MIVKCRSCSARLVPCRGVSSGARRNGPTVAAVHTSATKHGAGSGVLTPVSILLAALSCTYVVPKQVVMKHLIGLCRGDESAGYWQVVAISVGTTLLWPDAVVARRRGGSHVIRWSRCDRSREMRAPATAASLGETKPWRKRQARRNVCVDSLSPTGMYSYVEARCKFKFNGSLTTRAPNTGVVAGCACDHGQLALL